MIGKVPDGPDKRGERCEGLIYYLYGPGRHEEHTDPAHRRGLAAPGRAGAAAARGRDTGLPAAVRAAEPAARRPGQVGIPTAGLAYGDARRAARQDAQRR